MEPKEEKSVELKEAPKEASVEPPAADESVAPVSEGDAGAPADDTPLDVRAILKFADPSLVTSRKRKRRRRLRLTWRSLRRSLARRRTRVTWMTRARTPLRLKRKRVTRRPVMLRHGREQIATIRTRSYLVASSVRCVCRTPLFLVKRRSTRWYHPSCNAMVPKRLCLQMLLKFASVCIASLTMSFNTCSPSWVRLARLMAVSAL